MNQVHNSAAGKDNENAAPDNDFGIRNPSAFGRKNPSSRRSILADVFIFACLLLEFQTPRMLDGLRLQSVFIPFVFLSIIVARLPYVLPTISKAMTSAFSFFILYYALLICSTIWSYDPPTTLYHSTFLLLGVIAALSLERNLSKFTDQILQWALGLCVVSWLLAIAVPSIGAIPDIVWRLNGPMTHPQRLALVSSLGLIVTTIKLFGSESGLKRHTLILTGCILLATLVATKTRAFSVFFFISISYIIVFRSGPFLKAVAVTFLGVMATLVFFYFDDILEIMSRDGSNTYTLTGRTVIWAGSLALISERPLLGYGFATFFSDLTANFFTSGYIAPHAHNTWINSAFESGIVGAFLLTAGLLAGLFKFGLKRASYTSPLLLFAIMAGLTGIVFGGKITTLGTLILGIIAQEMRLGVPPKRRRMKFSVVSDRRGEGELPGQSNKPARLTSPTSELLKHDR